MARERQHLLRDGGLRYKVRGLMVRDLEIYEPMIKSVFADHGIPYFMDKKEQVHNHPLVEFIRASVEVVMSQWGHQPLFRLLKTDLIDIPRDDINLIENYVLAHGISGNLWLKDEDWTYTISFDLEDTNSPDKRERDYLQKINGIRKKIQSALIKFYRGMQPAKVRGGTESPLTVRDLSTALYDLLEKLKVPDTLGKWAQSAQTRGELSQVQLHDQIWGVLMDVLDQMVFFLGDKQSSLEDYLKILESGLAGVSLGLIPPSMDQILIGTPDRTRPFAIKALFVLGTSEGTFPIQIKESGLIDDRERELLKDYRLELAPTTEQKLFDEAFLIYNMITKPSQYLCLSYAIADEEGKALMPSSILSDLERLFSKLETEYAKDIPDVDAPFKKYATSPQKTVTYIMKTIQAAGLNAEVDDLPGDKKAILAILNRHFHQELNSAPEMEGLKYRNRLEPISASLLEEVYPDTINSSVSGLEQYMECPCKYYSSQMLKLKEREQFRLEPASFGLFYHTALKMFYDKLEEEGLYWSEVERDDQKRIVQEIVSQLAERLQNSILLTSARYQYFCEKLTELIGKAVEMLSLFSSREGFLPVGCEVGFGEGDLLSPYFIPTTSGHRITLRGRIDRVDCFRSQEKTYIRIIDYKGGTRDLDLRKLYYGLDLQLATYLLVAIEQGEALVGAKEKLKPGGMLYFAVQNPFINTENPLPQSTVDQKLKSVMKMKGYVLGEEELLDKMTREDVHSPDLLPYNMTKQGQFYKNSKVLSEKEFNVLLRFTYEKISQIGDRLLSGEVSPTPYKDGNQKACTYCSFLPVCQLDLSSGEHSFWHLPAKGDYLKDIVKAVEGEQADGS